MLVLTFAFDFRDDLVRVALTVPFWDWFVGFNVTLDYVADGHVPLRLRHVLGCAFYRHGFRFIVRFHCFSTWRLAIHSASGRQFNYSRCR